MTLIIHPDPDRVAYSRAGRTPGTGYSMLGAKGCLPAFSRLPLFSSSVAFTIVDTLQTHAMPCHSMRSIT